MQMDLEVAQDQLGRAAPSSDVSCSSVILDQVPAAFVLQDLGGIFRYANRHMARLCGLTPERLLGASMHDCLPKAEADLLAAIDARVEKSAMASGKEFDLTFKKGRRRISVIKFPVFQGRRQLTSIGTLGIDVTMRRKLETDVHRSLSDLAQAERQVGLMELSAALSHELNQPLTAVFNYACSSARLLASGRLKPEQQLQILGKIADEAERAGRIVNHLRWVFRNSRRAMGPVDVNAAVRTVFELTVARRQAARVALKTRLTNGLPPVRADCVTVEQIVLNLVSNAIDSMASMAGGERCLAVDTAMSAPDRVKVSVSDTGPGVPESIRPILYEPFITTKEGGSGLGLSICRTLTQRLGGTLGESPNSHGGETFCLELPIMK